MLDGLHSAHHTVVVALGILGDGRKVVLGPAGSPAMAAAIISSIISRNGVATTLTSIHTDQQPSLSFIKKASRIKHGIQKNYLGAWSGILGTKFSRLAYWDCFAGEGALADDQGEEIPGSPQHALRVGIEFVSKDPARSMLLGFIERDQGKARRLEQLLNRSDRPDTVKVQVLSADARDLTDHMMEQVRQFGWLVPAFFFVDPYGYPIPVPMLRKLLQLPKAEVLVNLMWYRISMDLGNPAAFDRLEKLFGHPAWRGQHFENLPAKLREQAFVTYFNQQVGTRFRIPFPMTYSPEDNVPAPEKRHKYYLIHFSKHEAACLAMKEVMNRADDRLQDLFYSEASLQLSFGFAGPDHHLDQLKALLLDTFRGQARTLRQIRELTANSPYVETEYRRVLKELEKEPNPNRKVTVDRRQSKRDGLADGDLIRFPR
jgi:three-Cys-motif partner protein